MSIFLSHFLQLVLAILLDSETLPNFPHPDTLAIRDVSFSETGLEFYCFILGTLARVPVNWKINGAVPGPGTTLSRCLRWGKLPASPLPAGQASGHLPLVLLCFLFPISSPFLQCIFLMPPGFLSVHSVSKSLLLRHLGSSLLWFIIVYLFPREILNQSVSSWTAGREWLFCFPLYPPSSSPKFPIPGWVQEKAR